jgi:hypothetical protein
MTKTELQQIKRKWTHSFEEDNEQEQVYRPVDFPFGRSRGRNQFDLKENGEVASFLIGRNDVPEQITGKWHIDGDDLVIDFHDGSSQVFPVKEVKEDKLVVKK